MMVATVILMRAEDLLLGAAVTGTAPTVLNANGANQKRFDESLLVRPGMKSQRARTNTFLWNDRSGRHEKHPGRRFQRKKKIPQFIGLVRAKTLPSFHRKNWPNFG